ncbi:unnamed protein product [Menidia menidia]|uniref:(Atlantic silverside) hypothetical protein n=1 Tax=Menidia menidia TaxID=238744 RepID=A0A8S4AV92_9TELE|nr:unnamed protein product [Menidia menidia]
MVLDREYETSSTGEDSAQDSQRSRIPAKHNSQVNVNGSIYVAQNGSIIRTRRSVNTTGPTTTSNNNTKLSSPVFSSRLAKHFKKLDKMAATLEERAPLSCPRKTVEAGSSTLHTFQSFRKVNSMTAASSFCNSDNNKMSDVLNSRQSSASLGSTSNSIAGPEGSASKPDLLRAACNTMERGESTEESDELKGESESRIDDSSTEVVGREPLECQSDRTQSDEEELWMGPWNSLHIPMTKL